MTHKQIAERLREIIQGEGPHPYTQLELLADTLDPPRPESGTVVWWRWYNDQEWRIGQVNNEGDGIRGLYWNSAPVSWERIEYHPARILADDEVAVKIPLVEEWTPNATAIGVYMSYGDSGCVKLRDVITRAEAEAREAK